MKKTLFTLLTIAFPGIPFLLMGDLKFFVIATFLQATVIGWIPAIMWSKNAWAEEQKAIAEEQKKMAKKTKIEISEESPERESPQKIEHISDKK